MSVSDKLKTDVEAKNLVAIRDGLWSCITLDPNFTEGFLESWQYCLNNGIKEADLYQEHDGRDIDLEPTGENFDLLAGHLSTNFSKERLNKMKEIGRKLYPVNEEKAESQTSANVNGNPKSGVDNPPANDDGDSGLLLLAGIAIGAIAGGAIGAAIFGKAVAAAVGAVIGAAGGTFVATQSTK